MFAFFLIFIIGVVSLLPLSVYGSCLRGLTNDPYPGLCSQYVDINHNYICDESEISNTPTPATNQVISIPVSSLKSNQHNYHFGFISLVVIGLYAISWLSASQKHWSIITHRQIWNILLGLHFLATAITGLLLVIKISLGLTFTPKFNLLFWHVETGIIFSLIAIFHIAWHWPYIKLIFSKSKPNK